MTTPTGGNTLGTDFDLMRAVAATTDTRNAEIRALLQAFISRMRGVPQTVWAGTAATRFQHVVDRWNAESLRLHHALERIAATIRDNERLLADAADTHSRQITAAGDGI